MANMTMEACILVQRNHTDTGTTDRVTGRLRQATVSTARQCLITHNTPRAKGLMDKATDNRILPISRDREVTEIIRGTVQTRAMEVTDIHGNIMLTKATEQPKAHHTAATSSSHPLDVHHGSRRNTSQ